MNNSEHFSYDALGLAELVRTKQISSIELLEVAIALTEKLDPKLNAVPIKHFELARENLKKNTDSGIFNGVPFLLKDLNNYLKGTVTSGGNLKLYFLNRSEYYAQQNRVHVKDVLQQMALFSEAYVVVAVALPIFAMIIAVITFWVSGAGMILEEIHMYLLIFAGFPVIQLIFSGLFYSLSSEISND